jgi:hypothetical protein
VVINPIEELFNRWMLWIYTNMVAALFIGTIGPILAVLLILITILASILAWFDPQRMRAKLEASIIMIGLYGIYLIIDYTLGLLGTGLPSFGNLFFFGFWGLFIAGVLLLLLYAIMEPGSY